MELEQGKKKTEKKFSALVVMNGFLIFATELSFFTLYLALT